MIVEAIIKRFNMKKVYTSITLKPIQKLKISIYKQSHRVQYYSKN
jgi:hypothetical protein